MVKKTVKLVPQERFDLIDARALQQGTLDYLGNALGNLMGYSNGLLSELTTSVAAADRTLNFTKSFAFFVTKAASEATDGTGFSGEVVIYDPTSPAQVTQSIDYTATYNAKEAYFADGSLDAEGNDADKNSRLLTIGAHAPFLWARPIKVEGQLDARRKWSVAQQTEVPVTMNTRTITIVEFALSSAMPEVAEGSSNWAPIAKIVEWTLATPKLLPVSAFDSYKWHARANTETLGDVDPDIPGVQEDYFSNQSPNLATYNIFERYDINANSPSVSLVYDMLMNDTHYENVPARQANATITDRLKQLATYLAGGGTFASADIKIKQSGQATAWNRFNGNSSNGIVDQLNAIRVALQNSVGSGILDHGAAWHDLHPRWKPYERGGASALSNLFTALRGAFRSHWSARPLRSLNSLALENIVLGDEAARHDAQITDLTTRIEQLEGRTTTLENAEDGFSSVPISDAQPLVPALSLTFKADYGVSQSGFKCFAGPSGAMQSIQFFIAASTMSKVTYARGGVKIRLSNECIASLGGRAAIDQGQIVIQATPVHFANSDPWLMPQGAYAVGKVDNQAQHEAEFQTADPDFDNAPRAAADRLDKRGSSQVLNAFANFYQCTLNVVVQNQSNDDVWIDIYPVNTVPDIIEAGHDLRGYPHHGAWVGRVAINGSVAGNDLWGDPDSTFYGQYDIFETGANGDSYVTWRGLAGDMTNPENFRGGKSGGADVADGNFVADGMGKTHIFGRDDDLRGFAQTVTFLRPDRFYMEAEGDHFRIAAPEYDARHNAPDTANMRNGEALDNFADLDNVIGRNGRFMPSFSLTLYKNSFTGLGTDINDDQIKTVLTTPAHNGVDIQFNQSNTPDAQNQIIRTGDTSTRGGS